ncbi:MAG: ATP-binding cassette domain-containing protein, partial [Proteobacteria bacterium]|nr:ATP-binding cassette domain-containing protein [Pseudomonadota bacterium]
QDQARLRRGDLAIAAVAGASAATAATLMLGLSGWFLAGAALAGTAGPLAVQAFNYLLPSAGLRGFAILRTAGRYGERLFAHRAALQALAALRPALFAGLAATPAPEALALSSGEASARLVQDVDAVETLFVRRSSPWVAAGAAIAAVVTSALASPLAGCAFLIGAALQIVLLRHLGARLGTSPATQQLASTGRLKAVLGAYASATAELRCFNLTDRAIEAVMSHDADLSLAVRRRRDAEAALDLLEALMSAATLVCVAGLATRAGLPLAALATLSAFAGLEGLGGLVRAARERGGAEAAITRLDAIVSEPSSGRPNAAPSGELRLEGLRLPPGDRVALIGPSGGGKTTLLESLLGLRRAPPGRLAVDGQFLEDAPLGWARPLFAYAPQDARLLTGTVADNLRLGAPEASDADLWAALEEARLDARVRRLPQGLGGWIGDGGEILSGGERRRLSLARALLRPAPWLLLDEPTEGLDAQTEAAVVDALEAHLARTGQGLILVSHRPAPLRLVTRRIAIDAAQPSEARYTT